MHVNSLVHLCIQKNMIFFLCLLNQALISGRLLSYQGFLFSANDNINNLSLTCCITIASAVSLDTCKNLTMDMHGHFHYTVIAGVTGDRST